MNSHVAFAALAAAAFAAGTASAEIAPADVVYGEIGEVQESLTGVAGDPEAGKAVFSSKSQGNCVSCHKVSSNEAEFPGNIGPSLDGAGSRWEEAQLRGIVADAKRVFPGSMMPSQYKTTGYIRPGDAFTGKGAEEPLAPLLTAQQVEDVVAYLMTLKDE